MARSLMSLDRFLLDFLGLSLLDVVSAWETEWPVAYARGVEYGGASCYRMYGYSLQ